MPAEKVNVNNLSPYQLAIQSAVGTGKNAHLKLTPELLGQIADQVFGPAPVPPGSTITYQGGDRIEWTDPEGYKHVATRNLDGRDPAAGQWRDNSDRPPILPPSQATQQLQGTLTGGAQSLSEQQLQNLLAQARGEKVAAYDPGIQKYLDEISGIATRLQGPTSMVALSPEDQAYLDTISAAEQAKLQQQFQQDQGALLARLYGNRINQSSIANAATGQLLQQQGLVSQQQQSDAARRALDTRQYLTNQELQRLNQALAGLSSAAGTQLEGFKASAGAGQAQQNALLEMLNSLLQQGTQRDIATGQLGLGFKELAERARQANQDFELRQQMADLELAKARAGSGPLGAALGLAGTIAGLPFGGGTLAGSLLGGLGIGRSTGAITGAGSTWPQN